MISGTCVGHVQSIVGAKVITRVDDSVPVANPIVNGHLYRFGQVGSFLKIPIGYQTLFGIVTLIGSSEWMKSALKLEADLPPGQRWLELQLVGESQGQSGFQRGVSVYPTLNDEVHLVTEPDLELIYKNSGRAPVEIGRHSNSEHLSATVDVEKLVTRHGAIVGSTGSGKSNTVAALVKQLASGFPNARIVVIDPHGEYASAFEGKSRVFRIGDETNPLVVPYWSMGFDEFAWFFVGRTTSAETTGDGALRDKLYTLRRETADELVKKSKLPDEVITADAPIWFDVKRLWYELDFRERATYKTKDKNLGEEEIADKGDAQKLQAAKFKPPAASSNPPFTPQPIGMASYLPKMLARLKDRRFDFICSPQGLDGKANDLHDLAASWMDHDQPLTIFDLGGVPSDVIDLVVGMITRILFELSFWGRGLDGIGRTKPTLVIFEEAHTYIPRGDDRLQGYARKAIRRLLKEGRKYGVGAIVVSQRPSELDDTVLSQCGTIMALRLTNTEDQQRVRAAVPDMLGGLVDLLAALRTGEAVIVGEAVPIPCRVRVPLIEPRPTSNDPDVAEAWRKVRVAAAASLQTAVAGWRIQEHLLTIKEKE